MKRHMVAIGIVLSVLVTQGGIAPARAGSEEQWIRLGVGMALEGMRAASAATARAERRKAAERAAARERRRVAELKKTRAGRAQLAREKRSRQAAERRNRAAAQAVIGAMFGSGWGSGSSGGDDAYQQTCRPGPDQRMC